MVIGESLNISVHRGKNNCIGSNPAHNWIFFINGKPRYQTGYGGPHNATFTIPLREEEFGTRIRLDHQIKEKKCLGGERTLGQGLYAFVDVPAKNPPQEHLLKGVYKIKVLGNNRELQMPVDGSKILWARTAGYSNFTRFIFEPSGTKGAFFIRISYHNQYLRADNSRIRMTAHPDQNSKFEFVDLGNGKYSIKQGGRYLYQDTNDAKIKLGNSNTSNYARFYLEELPRSVKFLATGDPQFENGNMAHDDNRFQRPRAVLDKFATYDYSTCEEDNRGVIISGDLTQNSRNDEIRKHRKLTKEYTDHLYDGFGNHDLNKRRYCGLINEGVCPDDLSTYISRPRATRFANRESIHYSWNWDDVHFVQLNLYPGDGPSHTSKNSNLSPKNSLSFLKRDLTSQVGNSDRPVVLIHHYGFDVTSVNNNVSDDAPYGWTTAEIKAYWDAIADYNVVAIITGHIHGYDESAHFEDWWTPVFTRPCGSSNGPDFIPTFVAGGADHGGYYISVAIEGETLSVTRHKAVVTTNSKNKITVTGFEEIDSKDVIIDGAADANDDLFTTSNFGGRIFSVPGQHAVYVIRNGRRRHIVDQETLYSLGYDWDDILCVSSKLMQSLPVGENIRSRYDGTLLSPHGRNHIYVMQGGERHWITSSTAFNRRNYNWNNVQGIALSELNQIPEGENYN